MTENIVLSRKQASTQQRVVTREQERERDRNRDRERENKDDINISIKNVNKII